MSSAAESCELFLSANPSPLRLITSLFGTCNVMFETKENSWVVAFIDEPPAVLLQKKGKIIWLVYTSKLLQKDIHQLPQPQISSRQKYLGCTFTESLGAGYCNFLHNSHNAMQGPPLLVFTEKCTA